MEQSRCLEKHSPTLDLWTNFFVNLNNSIFVEKKESTLQIFVWKKTFRISRRKNSRKRGEGQRRFICTRLKTRRWYRWKSGITMCHRWFVFPL